MKDFQVFHYLVGVVLPYDLDTTGKEGKFVATVSLNKPPALLMAVVSYFRASHRRNGSTVRELVVDMF